MLLIDDVGKMADQTGVTRATAANYRRSVRFYGEFLKRAATRDDLREPQVNEWLSTVGESRSSATVLGHKRSITAVWNWLADRELVPRYDSRNLRRVRLQTPPPRAWSLDQLRQLLAGADSLAGRLRCGVDASVMMRAWVLFGYETAMRPGDIRRVRARDFDDNRVSIVQSKTGNVHFATLSPAAMDALAPLLNRGDCTLFPASRNTMRRWELRLFSAAEQHGFRRQHGQGLGTLRKTNATEICRRDGLDAAARSLGHVSGTAIAKRYYVSPDAISQTPTPPALLHVLATPAHDRVSNCA